MQIFQRVCLNALLYHISTLKKGLSRPHYTLPPAPSTCATSSARCTCRRYAPILPKLREVLSCHRRLTKTRLSPTFWTLSGHTLSFLSDPSPLLRGSGLLSTRHGIQTRRHGSRCGLTSFQR